MRIIQIVESLEMGGLERLAVNLAVEQKRRGDDPQIYCVCRRGRLADDAETAGVQVRCFNKQPGPKPLTVLKIARALMSDHPDVIHTHNPNIHHYGAVAAKLAGVPVVVNTRHSPLSPEALMYRERHFRRAARFTDAIAFVSDAAQSSIVRGLNLTKVRTVVVLNGIPLESYLKNSAAPLFVRPRLRFGTLGRMVPEKAHDLLIDAFRSVLRAFPEAELRIAGGGTLYEALRAQAASSGLGARVMIEEATNNPVGFLQNLDVFVLSSRSEGLPLVLLEAMAAGLPIVATRVGGIPEFLPEDIGWLCAPEDPRALADAMISAVNSPDLFARVARAKSLVGRQHSIAATCDSYYNLFADVAASKSISAERKSRIMAKRA